MMSAIPPSAFTPLSIAGCQLWLDASQLTGLTNNDPLSTWTDFSTHGRNATQTGGNRPTYKTGVQNGLPAILFDRTSSQYMTGSLTLSQPVTIFAVAQNDHSTSTYEFYFDSTTNRIALLRVDTAIGAYEVFAGADAMRSATADTGWHYITGVANGSSSIVAVDGSATTGLAAGSNSLGSTYMVGASASAANHMSGYIAELIIYDTALSSGDRVLVQNYLKAKYGL